MSRNSKVKTETCFTTIGDEVYSGNSLTSHFPFWGIYSTSLISFLLWAMFITCLHYFLGLEHHNADTYSCVYATFSSLMSVLLVMWAKQSMKVTVNTDVLCKLAPPSPGTHFNVFRSPIIYVAYMIGLSYHMFREKVFLSKFKTAKISIF